MERLVLVNDWDEIVCYLEELPNGFYKLPDKIVSDWLMSEGDVYRVKRIWLEV